MTTGIRPRNQLTTNKAKQKQQDKNLVRCMLSHECRITFSR